MGRACPRAESHNVKSYMILHNRPTQSCTIAMQDCCRVLYMSMSTDVQLCSPTMASCHASPVSGKITVVP